LLDGIERCSGVEIGLAVSEEALQLSSDIENRATGDIEK